MTNTTPCLRFDLDYIPIQHEGKNLVLIRDPLGLVAEGMALPRELFELLAGLDDRTAPAALLKKLQALKGGESITERDIRDMLHDLDTAYLFQTPRFTAAREKIVAEFASNNLRPSVLSGRSFPPDEDSLAALLDEILDSGGAQPADASPLALVAPHIDLDAGRRAYAAAYNPLKNQTYDRVVILGIGHQLSNGSFCLTDKDFETPLGRVRTDVDAVARLRRAGEHCLAPDDFAHRDEHSIEFQLLFLQHILGNASFTAVPILCGSLIGSLPEYSRTAFRSAADSFLHELGQLLTDTGRRTLLVAGVDLCHIGPKFGHQQTATDLEAMATAHDTELLERLVARDSDGLWAESQRINDRLNVCGFSALATLVEILPSCRGQLLDYRVWHEPQAQSAVSFAAALFSS